MRRSATPFCCTVYCIYKLCTYAILLKDLSVDQVSQALLLVRPGKMSCAGTLDQRIAKWNGHINVLVRLTYVNYAINFPFILTHFETDGFYSV